MSVPFVLDTVDSLEFTQIFVPMFRTKHKNPSSYCNGNTGIIRVHSD